MVVVSLLAMYGVLAPAYGATKCGKTCDSQPAAKACSCPHCQAAAKADAAKDAKCCCKGAKDQSAADGKCPCPGKAKATGKSCQTQPAKAAAAGSHVKSHHS